MRRHRIDGAALLSFRCDLPQIVHGFRQSSISQARLQHAPVIPPGPATRSPTLWPPPHLSYNDPNRGVCWRKPIGAPRATLPPFPLCAFAFPRLCVNFPPLSLPRLCSNRIATPYTRRGIPTLYCSRACRNTANSRAGSAERARLARLRVAAGVWINPATINRPTLAVIGAAVRRTRLAQVAAGTWRNPALDDEARRKLSRPRKHGDNPVLHSTLEKLRQKVELTEEEWEAHRVYRRRLRTARKDELNAYMRQAYRRRQATMTPEQRKAQRQKWRDENKRRAKRPRE